VILCCFAQVSLSTSHTPAPSRRAGIILNKSSAIPMAAKAWWTLFETDPISAVHKLTHMVLEMCGIQETLPLSVFQEDDGTDMDVDDYIKKLVAQYTSEKNAQLVPMLFGANKQAKKNQNNFADFWSKWVSHAPESEVQFLHENSFCPWLYAMSTSQLTVLRHAAATVGVEIMIALVGKANDNLEAMSNIERLHNAAKGVQKDRLQEQLDDKRKVRSDTEKALESFFNSLVVHRHRDIESQIRAKSIKAIGELVVRYKHMFLDNKYLKYVGWALSDKKEDVRLTALGAIQNFYEEDLAQELELFTGRFKERVVQMRFDKDRQVQLLAIDTAKVMVQKSLFVDEEVETMLQMITEEDPLVRGAVADFIQATFVEIDLEVAYEAHAKKTPSESPHPKLTVCHFSQSRVSDLAVRLS
jgi:cohesin complex subunit SA-1/2